MNKHCKICNQDKPSTDFYASEKNKCKECYKARQREYRKALKEGTKAPRKPIVNLAMLRTCKVCNNAKAIVQFDYLINKKANLRRSTCKQCRSEKNKIYYKKTHKNLNLNDKVEITNMPIPDVPEATQ